jgi:mono/diheme cytochrome c family protein
MRSPLALIVGITALSAWTVGMSAQGRTAAAGQHDAGAHQHAEAAALKNPVKATPASTAAGKKLYDTQCVTCHGATGKGDGRMAASITTGPKPSDLTDASWKHGSTDGEIFTIIRDGSKGTGMRGYAARMKPDDIWNVVNYLRTLGPAPAKP